MVYVDESLFQFGKQLYCHMWSPDVAELHKMADQIRLKRSWFQNKPGFPHYDLSPQKRKMAIQRGAVAITCKDLVRMVKMSKKQQPSQELIEANEKLQEMREQYKKTGSPHPKDGQSNGK